MALSPISPSLAQADTYARINAAITEAGKVAGKQDAFDLAGLLSSVSSLATALNGKAAQSDLTSLTQLVNLKATQAAVDALSALVATKIDASQLGGIKPIFRASGTLVQAKAAGDAAWTTLFDYALLQGPAGLNPEIGIDPANQTSLRWRLAGGAWNPLFDLALLKGRDGRDGGLYPYERPGDGIQYFTADATTREPSAYPDLDTARLVQTVEGRGYDLTSAGRVVSKQAFVVEPFETYRARCGFLRTAAPADPSGDTFRFGLICLNGAGAVIGEVVLQDWASIPLNTYTTTTRFFSRLSPPPEGASGLPDGTRSVRLFLQAFGGAQHSVALLLSWNNGGSGGTAGGGAAEAQAAAAAAMGFRDQAGAFASAAQASAVDAAKAAPGYATLAQLNADLNWPAGATKQVINDGANNGTYVKSGAANAGAWTRFSTATVPGLDARALIVEALLALTKSYGADSPYVAAFIDQYGRANVGLTPTFLRTFGIDIGRDAQGRPQLRLSTGGKASVTLRDDGVVAVPGLAIGGIGLGEIAADPDIFVSLDPFGRGRKHIYADGSIGINGHRVWASPRTDIAFGLVDRFGRGKVVAGSGSSSGAGGYSAEEINRRDTAALSSSEGISRNLNTSSARAIAAYNLWQSYGQSLSVGGSGAPHITRQTILDALMMGDAVHSGGPETTWTPRGAAAFNPLIGFTTSSGRGETYLEGAIAMFRRLSLDRQGVDADMSRRLVAAATGVPGETIENLSRGASTGYFNRTVAAAQVMKSIAGAAPVGMPVVLFDQGQANTGGFGTTDRATWLGLARQVRADIAQYAANAVLGQTRPPLFALFQTGGGFQRDNVNMSIAMAQFDMMDDPDTLLIGPTYYVTSRDDAHLTGNGYRWMGCLAGKALFRALVLGEGWRPLSPLSATVRGDEVLITHHVPVPPLQWGLPYIGRTATDFAAKGYRVFDASGDCGISGAEIVGQATVRLKLGRASVGATTIRYAGQATFTGHGCLRDSDRTRAPLTYDFYSDLDADENIPDLVGKPYPMNNWCVGYQMPLTRD